MAILALFFIMITDLCCTVSPYVFYQEPMSWFEAQTYCRNTNTDLATVLSSRESELMLRAAAAETGYAWIGLFDDMTKWKWSLGNVDLNSSHFRNWASSNPNYYPNGPQTRICVKMQTDGFWDDVDCSSSIPKVCFDDPDGYTFLSTPNIWSDSQSYCRGAHTDLASVRDINENILIGKKLNKDAWIGLYRHTWTNWSDGTFSTISNWDLNKNDFLNTSATFHCAMVYTQTGMWFRASCNTKLPFICNEEAQVISGGGGQMFNSGNAGTTGTGTGSSQTLKSGYISRIKLRLKTDGNSINAAIQIQILQQIAAKLEEQGLTYFKLHWTQMEKESIDKDKEGEEEGLH